MPIKIPAGYAVTYNKFHDVDPILAEDEKNHIKNWHYFTEDIIQICKLILIDGKHTIPDENYFIIDLGWYPDSSFDGEYNLVLAYIENGWNEIKSFKSKDRFLIRDTMEIWLRELNNNQTDDGF